MKSLFTSLTLTLGLLINPSLSFAALDSEDIAACKAASIDSSSYLYFYKEDGTIDKYFENASIEEGDFDDEAEYKKTLAGHYMAESILTGERGEEFLKKGFTDKEFFQFCISELEKEDLEQKRFDARQTCTTLRNEVYDYIYLTEKLRKDPVKGFWALVNAEPVEKYDEFANLITKVINETLDNDEGNEFIRGKGRNPNYDLDEMCFGNMIKHF